jgi:hypothetical protein
MTLQQRDSGVNLIKRDYAIFSLRNIWKGVTDEALKRGAAIAVRYQLDPFLKELVMMKFVNKDTQETTWDPVLSIVATRKIAGKNGTRHWSYVDGPRLMSPDEIKNVYQDEAPQNAIIGLTTIEFNGCKYPGYGVVYRNETIREMKGHSRANAAMIRSERAALDRAFPRELPDVDVVEGVDWDATVDAETIKRGAIEAQAKADKATEDLFGPSTALPPGPDPTPLPPTDPLDLSGEQLPNGLDTAWLKNVLHFRRADFDTFRRWIKATYRITDRPTLEAELTLMTRTNVTDLENKLRGAK